MSKKVIPRSKLVGMQVYNPDATLVGTIKDIGLVPGEAGSFVLIVTTRYQTQIEIEWEKVKEVGDIVLLGEKVEVEAPERPVERVAEAPATGAGVATPQTSAPICPTCGKPATWIPQYKRWYCYNCRKYL